MYTARDLRTARKQNYQGNNTLKIFLSTCYAKLQACIVRVERIRKAEPLLHPCYPSPLLTPTPFTITELFPLTISLHWTLLGLEWGHISNRMSWVAAQFIVLGKWGTSAIGNIKRTIINKLINSTCSAWCGKTGSCLTVPVWEKCTLSVSIACPGRLRGHVARRKLSRWKTFPFY